MSVENFDRSLHDAKLSKNDKEWFPRWIRRYASSVKLVEGRLPVSPEEVIRFLQSLLKSQTPAWQRLQAVRAIEIYRDLVLHSEVPSLISWLTLRATTDTEEQSGIVAKEHTEHKNAGKVGLTARCVGGWRPRSSDSLRSDTAETVRPQKRQEMGIAHF